MCIKCHKVDFIGPKKKKRASTLHNFFSFSEQKGEKVGHVGNSVDNTAVSVDSQRLLYPVIMLCLIWLHWHDE